MSNGWGVISGESETGTEVAHIVPMNDTRTHELSNECWCNPELDHEYRTVTHHSADNRESYENKTRLLN